MNRIELGRENKYYEYRVPVILRKEVSCYALQWASFNSRKRGVCLCSGVTDLPLPQRSGVSLCFTASSLNLGKVGFHYAPVWTALYSEKSLSVVLRGSNSFILMLEGECRVETVLPGHRCLIPHWIWGSVPNLLVLLPLLHIRVA